MRIIVLYEIVVHSGRGQRISAIGFKEEPTLVFEDAGLDQQDTGKRSCDDFQSGLKEGARTPARTRLKLLRTDDYNPCFVNMLRCSVIVVTHNSSAPIEACLRALASQGCEIVLVDNASQDDTVARVRALEGELALHLIAVSRNIGFAGGVNQGVAAASGSVLLLLNPDAMAEAGAIQAILSAFERFRADAVGGALLDDRGQPARGFTFRRLPTLSALLCEVLLVNQVWPENPVNRRYRCLDAELTREQEVEQPAGACLAVRREVWDRLHGMDAGFFPVWFEDVDFCARLEESGAKTVYCPAARFRHSGAHSVGQLAFRDQQLFWYGNMLRYAGKHFSTAQVAALRAGIVLGMCARMLASLLGGGPQVVRRSEAVRAYAGAALLAVGIGATH